MCLRPLKHHKGLYLVHKGSKCEILTNDMKAFVVTFIGQDIEEVKQLCYHNGNFFL